MYILPKYYKQLRHNERSKGISLSRKMVKRHIREKVEILFQPGKNVNTFPHIQSYSQTGT